MLKAKATINAAPLTETFESTPRLPLLCVDVTIAEETVAEALVSVCVTGVVDGSTVAILVRVCAYEVEVLLMELFAGTASEVLKFEVEVTPVIEVGMTGAGLVLMVETSLGSALLAFVVGFGPQGISVVKC